MRRLLWIVAVLAVVAGALLLAAIFSLNRIVAANRDRIIREATTAIGRPVSVARITVSVWGGLGVRLEQVQVAEDKAFGDSPFVRAAGVTARASLWPLLHGHLEVGRIDVQQPQVQLVRDRSGRWNYTTLKIVRTAQAPPDPSPRIILAAATAAAVPSVADAPPFFIQRATIAGGTLVVTDRTQAPPRTTRVTQIDLDVSNVSPSTPIRFDLQAALASERRNLRLEGTAGPLNSAKGIPLSVGGDLGPLGPEAVTVDDLQLTATVTPVRVQVPHVAGHVFGGSFALSGQYPLGHGGNLALKGELKDIAVGAVLALRMKDAAQHITGSGDVSVDVSASGSSAGAIEASLAGTVTAAVHDGVIHEFNLPSEVLGRVTGLPGVGALISAKVKPKYARLFSDPTTRFEQLRGTFHIAERRVRTDDLAIIATDYGVRATGWVDFDRHTDLSGTLLMSKQFSSDVAADVKEAKYLLDPEGQLAVPFRLRGTLGQAKPEPDTRYLIDALTRALGNEAAGGLLRKLFGGKQQK